MVGWGEHTLIASDATHGRTVESAVRDMMDEFIVGADPRSIEHHWQRLYRRHYRGGPVLMSAMSGIDQALWDIKGKSLGVPVWELLGGSVRDRIRLYQHVYGESPEDCVRDARKQIGKGFTALKLVLGHSFERVDTPARVSAAVERFAAVRDEVGADVDVGIDFHGRVTKPMAKQVIDGLAPHGPMWIEEPVLPEYLEEFVDIAGRTSIQIATGERLFSRWDFKQAFARNALDVGQPDVSHAGGISETRRIANMAEAHDIAIAPHMPFGPIGLAASLQVAACTPAVFLQEQTILRKENLALEYVANESLFELGDEGHVDVPTAPGLGIELNEAMVRELDGELDFEPTYWTNRDGSVVDK
jgi:galactonate dehydratase